MALQEFQECEAHISYSCQWNFIERLNKIIPKTQRTLLYKHSITQHNFLITLENIYMHEESWCVCVKKETGIDPPFTANCAKNFR